jgi:hypothetical protein
MTTAVVFVKVMEAGSGYSINWFNESSSQVSRS